MHTTRPDSDWTIKSYISQCAQKESHTVTSPRTCRFTPSCGQLVHPAHPLVPPQPPVAPPVWSIEPSAEPWNSAWDIEAPDELNQFLLEVLLTPTQAFKHSSRSEQHQQNLSVPAPAPDLLSKVASPVDRPNASRSKGVTTAEAEAAAAPGSSEPASVSLDTVTDNSVDSDAATSTAAFSHAVSAQQTKAATAPSQTPSSRKRSRAGSEQTDAQTAPDILHSQPANGRPSKKVKRATGSKSAKPVLSSAEIAQAAKDGVVFAKFARFAHWPTQVSRQHDLLAWLALLQRLHICFRVYCAADSKHLVVLSSDYGGQAHVRAFCRITWSGVMLFLCLCKF